MSARKRLGRTNAPKDKAPGSDDLWLYRDPNGQPLFYVREAELTIGGQTTRICRPVGLNGEDLGWDQVVTPRPLFNVHRFAAEPLAPILLCMSAGAADAAERLFPTAIPTALTDDNGTAADVDWSSIYGRQVRIWPSAGHRGAEFTTKVAELARTAGATAVEVLDLAELLKRQGPGGGRRLQDGGPLEATAAGWTAQDIDHACQWVAIADHADPGHGRARDAGASRRKRDASHERGTDGPGGDEPPRPLFESTDRGVFWCGSGEGRQGREQRVWLCSALRVVALTRDAEGLNWGRLLETRDADGTRHVWAMPMALLSGSGEELRGELLRLGVEITTEGRGRRLLLDYIQGEIPKDRARCTTRTGWHGSAFVLPETTLGEGKERVLYQSETPFVHSYKARGTLEEWRRQIAEPCARNSRLMFSVASAFAALLLEPLGDEGGGFHLRGSSSSGKTTALRVAASVYGPPDYVNRWRATDNGLEALAELHNDTLLVLDELAQVDPSFAGQVAYMLANGSGKSRADRGGGARTVRRWRLLFLSAGEVGLAEHMAQAGRRARAGQEVRLADVPADAGTGLGLFEDLHGGADGAAFARRLLEASAVVYGTGAPAFIVMVLEKGAALISAARSQRAAFVEEVLSGLSEISGQTRRVAERFGLVGVAGELATAAGITGWTPGESIWAAGVCFRAWIDGRGGPGDAEEVAVVGQVRHFFEMHSESRFTQWDRVGDDHAPRTSNRAGFVRMDGLDQPTYYVLPEVFRREIVAGFDHRWAALVLAKVGLLQLGADGRASRKERLPGFHNPVRCYVFPDGGKA